MKKFIAFLLAAAMVFCLSACGSNPYKDLTDKDIDEKVADGSFGELQCYYSVQNEDKTDKEIIVHFPSDIYDEERDNFYDADDETYVTFYGDKVFYDKETGKEISEDQLTYGQLLKITYNGEVYGKNPIMIKAIRIVVCG